METTTDLTQLIIEDIIPSRINKTSLQRFLEEADPDNKYSHNASKLSLVYDFFNNCNDAENKFSEFAIKNLMYGKSRVITESDIASIPQPITSKKKLLNQLGITENELNFNNIMSFNPCDKFKTIYRNVVLDEDDGEKDKIKHIDIVFARKYIDPSSERQKLRGEYVGVEIDFNSFKVWLHMSSRHNNQVNRELPSQPILLFNYFRAVLHNHYGLMIRENSEEDFIFKLYSYLTKKDEEKYLEKVSKEENKIEEFCDSILENLDIEDDDNEVSERVKGVFLRKIIQNDFNNFTNNPNVEGRVKAFIFSDPEGTRLQASKGPGRSLIGDEINIESSTAYFDNKETINKAQKLFSVLIVWTPGYDDISNFLQVRYTAYPGFLETHFLYSDITEDEYKNVLQKIRRIRKSNEE
ncbi:hypothetical protein LMB58_06595 [Limosilactobacillus reuteri]|uniref:hypothetical protein n=1 Tax=Limosilactobacillus reuteri TaxID=1598 RepID=UPI001E5182E7|nr:hypothetical protein [Limosilactobacillus reuteri]MCC4328184.1 hypothetical protein [Limosilactobacillus reuteri]MCC4336450.1 hypothetical protein [Limosilactobacillus reuteri]MCC4338224.1 hypothetical protein [Limosilactobacillus reuteri]